ncbi:putative mfs monosaccharide transporter protein [Phaeoacremonium minimum UCRPA7]|uniref:Putative mfs monosaccharide transporter protein n=1 Tax=Phaeoacremonium minimum (strain UCR-PA7) TaxID=1286976 RepID=R8B8W8_PHAM7|nr:putative mfs monosaccharide transporter protein [Phaeoacremonium minimum UCRPA7]EON95722.1 putative mfs monosaccharide transporter protein [Phaeoacremonium minimum UCRPA7]
MPNSPRQLIQKGNVEAARREFIRIRSDLHSHEVHEEFGLMRAQIEYEITREIPSYREIFKLYRHRVLVSISVQVLTSVTGVNVIQYYQTSLYKSLGISAQTILALAAVWGTCAFVSNAIAIVYLPDRLGRRKMLLAGISCVIITEIYAAVMQREFQNTNNRVGKGFAILGIYLFVVCYFTEAGPSAFANIHENYYYVFIGCCIIYLGIIYFYYPETNQKTLEEIAAAFGDHVVEVDEQEIVAEGVAMESKAVPVHLEDARSA